MEQINEKDFKQLCNIIKRYVNFKVVLYHIDKNLSEEFAKKQEAYFELKRHLDEYKHLNTGCCGESILNNTIFIDPEKMNNIEKNLKEIYDKFYYPIYIEELIEYLREKNDSIIKKGKKEGISIGVDEEKDFIHNIFKNGVNYFLYQKLVKKLKEYEESISSQPMLLAHPRNIEEEDVLDFIPKYHIPNLIKESYFVCSKPYLDMYDFNI